jgi:hypothetical protein
MHERDERHTGLEGAGLGQRPERKSINDSRTAGRHGGQLGERGRALRDARERKALAYVGDIHLPTQPPKLLDNPSIIAITSGGRGEVTGHGKRNMHYLG